MSADRSRVFLTVREERQRCEPEDGGWEQRHFCSFSRSSGVGGRMRDTQQPQTIPYLRLVAPGVAELATPNDSVDRQEGMSGSMEESSPRNRNFRAARQALAKDTSGPASRLP